MERLGEEPLLFIALKIRSYEAPAHQQGTAVGLIAAELLTCRRCDCFVGTQIVRCVAFEARSVVYQIVIRKLFLAQCGECVTANGGY